MQARVDGQELTKRLESLLLGFGSAQNAFQHRISPADSLRRLLEGFRAVSAQEEEEQSAHVAKSGALLKGFRCAIASWRSSQEHSADEFDLLDVMGVVGRETMHSRVLAWLLACSPAGHGIAGTHSQGSLGLRLLLAELAEMKWPKAYADAPYWVRTEVRGTDSIIDIEVACRGRFIIHIENKIWSDEGTNQTRREWDDLSRRAGALGISQDHCHAIFLTPRGTPAKDPRFTAISWMRVARVFEAFAERAKPTEISLFCRHYADALRRSVVNVEELGQADNDETTVQ